MSFSGALGGAASGAGLGSAFGPIGTAIGGIGGGLLGLFGGGNKQPKIKRQSLLNPNQEQALQRYLGQGIETSPLYQQGSSYLQNLLSGSPEAFSAFEDPLKQNFENYVVPQITERFAGMGTGAGALNSSALQNALADAGRRLTTDIGGLRGGLQMQGLNQALGYAQQPYSNTLGGLGVQSFQPYERPGQAGFGTQVGSGLFNAIGQGVGQRGGQFFSDKLFGNSFLGKPGA